MPVGDSAGLAIVDVILSLACSSLLQLSSTLQPGLAALSLLACLSVAGAQQAQRQAGRVSSALLCDQLEDALKVVLSLQSMLVTTQASARVYVINVTCKAPPKACCHPPCLR